MAENLVLDEFKNALFKAAAEAGFSDYELYYSSGNSFSVRIFKGEISEYKNAKSVGVSFRGTYNGKMGYAFSEKIGLDVIDFLVNNAKQNAEIIEDSEKEELYAGGASYAEVKCFEPSLALVSAAEKIDAALLMEKTAYEADERVKSVDYCAVITGEGEMAIMNSFGLDLKNKGNYAYAYIYPRVEENGQVKSSGDVFIGNDFSAFNPEQTAKSAVNLSLAALGAKPLESKKYKVLLNNLCASDLIATFITMFFADKVQKGFSLLGGKLGQKIANEKITILDDALMDNALGSTPFDSEGVATANKTVVENGVLKTYLHNLKTAKKDGVNPTGNGFKVSFKSSVAITATNFYVKPANQTYEQLIEEMGDGFIVTDLAGLHSGANETSGDFSLSAEGFLVENGKITQSVEQVTIAGNFLTMLNDVLAVGSDLRFTLPGAYGNIASPCLLIKELSVSGI